MDKNQGGADVKNGKKLNITKCNQGSTTVEATLMMPVFLLVVFMLVGLLLDLLNEAEGRKKIYRCIYTLDMAGEAEEEIVEKISISTDELSDAGCKISVRAADTKDGLLTALFGINEAVSSSVYNYGGARVNINKEYDKCTSRLRRWQLYGNVLHK